MAGSNKFGWFLGLVFGALVGVLFAPRKGKDLREKIKSDRKKGALGFAPLQDDFKTIGLEIADIAIDIYNSDAVSNLVETGRRNFKNISDDFVGEVADFHKTRIRPLTDSGEEMSGGAKKAFRSYKAKAKKSVKISKKAVGEIKKTFRNK